MTDINEIKTPAQIIRECPLFARVSPPNIQTLASVSVERSFDAGEMILQQGDECPGIFIVQSGTVRVFTHDSADQQHVLHLCRTGQSFAEVAVFAGFPLPASALSVDASRCLMIPSEAINGLIATNHLFCREMLSSMAFWTRHFVDLLGDIVLRNATDRVANYLQSLPRDSAGIVELPGPKKDVANHLNLSSETFSRTLRRLADSGQIELTAGRGIKCLA